MFDPTPRLHGAVEIRRLTAADYFWFDAVYALYLHDLSAYGGAYQLNDNGVWQPDYRAFWRDVDGPGTLWLMVWGGRRVGFACIGAGDFPYKSADADVRLSEFFVLRGYRGLGIARQAVAALRARYGGRWELSVLSENETALMFWRRCLADADALQEHAGADEVLLRFVNHADRPTAPG